MRNPYRRSRSWRRARARKSSRARCAKGSRARPKRSRPSIFTTPKGRSGVGGAGRRVGLLLDALSLPRSYVAIDISREFLLAGAEAAAKACPALRVVAVHGDYAG